MQYSHSSNIPWFQIVDIFSHIIMHLMLSGHWSLGHFIYKIKNFKEVKWSILFHLSLEPWAKSLSKSKKLLSGFELITNQIE